MNKENRMNKEKLSSKIMEYATYLQGEERSGNTISKYVRDLRAFYVFWGGGEITKTAVLQWKDKLTQQYAPASVNSMLAAVNGFFNWQELPQFKVKPLKIQREIFARPEKELTKQEYSRLVQAAQNKHNERLALLLQTICATGIRVSELPFITAKAIHTGRVMVDCKGKSRTVFLPKELCRSLLRYCREQKITNGVVFCTASGAPLDRSNIWRDMKALCISAGVEQSKVFPYNLRHLFAGTYYSIEKDLSRLADLLGHSSITTTRIYTMETGAEHIRQIERMGLVLAKKE